MRICLGGCLLVYTDAGRMAFCLVLLRMVLLGEMLGWHGMREDTRRIHGVSSNFPHKRLTVMFREIAKSLFPGRSFSYHAIVLELYSAGPGTISLLVRER